MRLTLSNTCKLYNALNAQVVTCWIVTREVNSSNPICVCFSCFVFFLTAFSFSDKKPFTERQCLCLCFLD